MTGSSALSAWLLLITLATIIYRSAGQSSQLIACNQPDSFTVQITENENVVVYGTELLIKYNPRAEIHPLPGTDAVNVVYNESTIQFKGYMSPEYPDTLPWGSPEILSWTSSGIILGTGTLQKLSREDYTVRECRSFLPKNIKSSGNLPYTVADEIANHARYCIEEYLCRGLGPINMTKLRDVNKYHSSRPRASSSYAIASYDSSQENCTSNSVLSVNDPVDFAINIAVHYIKNNNKSTFIIPNVDESHELGPFGMKVYFQAINGSFEDLTTIERAGDAYISATGRTHVIKLGFGLSKAKFHFDYYKIKYGIMSLNGELTGTINGISLAISIVADYDKACPLTMEYIKVTKIGDIQIDMTGLGINSVTSKIVSWLTNMWRENIVSLVEVTAKQTIDQLLSNMNICNSYKNAIAG